MNKGIGYCHASRRACGNWRALRRARELAKSARSVLDQFEPMDRKEKKQLEQFKRAIERFEKADK